MPRKPAAPWLRSDYCPPPRTTPRKPRRPAKTLPGLRKPKGQGARLAGISLGRDARGYYVYTHRARSRSYPSPAAIPASEVRFIRSTR